MQFFETKSPCLVLLLFLLFAPNAFGQESLLNKTLNFRDVTVTTINQTVPEIIDNEKKIEFGDYDNDGDLDVVVSVGRGDFGQRRNKLYRNDDGILNEVSGAPVIPDFTFTDTSRAALFMDFDNDGFVDIVISNDSNSGSASDTSPGKTKFIRNVDGQFFVNESSRLDGLTGPAGDAVAADLDQNGAIDVVMTNHPNISQDSMVLNGINGNPAGEFTEVTLTNLPVDSLYGGQINSADMNGDGLLDLLVAQTFRNQNDLIYLNNNNNAGSGPGDFRYGGPGERQIFSGPGREQLMLPADFDNDGRMDFYYSNNSDTSVRPDQIRRNIGNNDIGVPQFDTFEMPSDVDATTTRVAASDLDDDGRIDIIVVSEFQRPHIFRNTTENGELSFVEWTPPEIHSFHTAWGVGVASLLGPNSTDLMIGAMNDDVLFEKIASPQFDAVDLAGQLPALFDLEPIQVVGQVGNDGVIFTSENIPSGASLSVLLRSAGDLTLTATNGTEKLTSNRPGHATDEAIHFDTTDSGVWEISIQLESLAYDGNGDGLVNLLDVNSFVDCLTGSSSNCEVFDTDDDGLVTLLDVSKFVDRLAGAPQQEEYSLEILVRDD